jgi:mRNA interferase MazF
VFKRGDIVTIGVQGDFGKPRPALLIQSEMFNEAHATLTVLLISSELIDAPLFRLSIEPDQINGLTQQSQIQVDKALTVRREKVGQIIGRVDDAMMVRVNRALALWIGLA